MVKQSREPFLPPFPGCISHTIQSLEHSFPALCRARVGLNDVLLGRRPFLPNPLSSVLRRSGKLGELLRDEILTPLRYYSERIERRSARVAATEVHGNGVRRQGPALPPGEGSQLSR